MKFQAHILLFSSLLACVSCERASNSLYGRDTHGGIINGVQYDTHNGLNQDHGLDARFIPGSNPSDLNRRKTSQKGPKKKKNKNNQSIVDLEMRAESPEFESDDLVYDYWKALPKDAKDDQVAVFTRILTSLKLYKNGKQTQDGLNSLVKKVGGHMEVVLAKVGDLRANEIENFDLLGFGLPARAGWIDKNANGDGVPGKFKDQKWAENGDEIVKFQGFLKGTVAQAKTAAKDLASQNGKIRDYNHQNFHCETFASQLVTKLI